MNRRIIFSWCYFAKKKKKKENKPGIKNETQLLKKKQRVLRAFDF
jgi:hypothetical protein